MYAQDLFAGRRVVAVATHAHFDHVGGLHEFDERVIHSSEASIIEDPARIRGWLRFERDPDAGPVQVEEAGYALPGDGELLTAVAAAGFDRDHHSVVPCTATRTVDDGDVLDLGDRAFRVLHLPGHSPGSIGLWLLSGDAVYDGPLLDGNASSDIAAYLRHDAPADRAAGRGRARQPRTQLRPEAARRAVRRVPAGRDRQ